VIVLCYGKNFEQIICLRVDFFLKNDSGYPKDTGIFFSILTYTTKKNTKNRWVFGMLCFWRVGLLASWVSQASGWRELHLGAMKEIRGFKFSEVISVTYRQRKLVRSALARVLGGGELVRLQAIWPVSRRRRLQNRRA